MWDFFPTYFVSCNGPCTPKEKWHRKEHIIIIIIIIITIIIIKKIEKEDVKENNISTPNITGYKLTS